MFRRIVLALTSAAAVLAGASRGEAAILTFNSLADWTAAAGTPSWTVDFSSFAADTSFELAPVDAGPFSLQQQGARPFRNLVEVAPFVFLDNNGTTHASMFTDFGVISVLSSFDTPIQAWGADFTGVDAEGVVLNLGALGNLIVPTGTNFFGFVFTAGEQISSLTFQSQNDDPTPNGGEGFSVDNFVGAQAVPDVPEPASALLVGIGLVGLTLLRARQRT